MGFYIGIISVLFFFSFMDFFKNSLANKITFFIISICIIFISGFRYGLETDYWSYYKIFHGVEKINIEPGYILFSNIIKGLTNNFNYFLVIVSMLFLGGKFKIFEKFEHPFIILFIYFLKFFILLELNVIRQGMAVTFIFISVYYLWKGKDKHAVFFILLGSCFHLSSLIFFVVFAVRRINWNLRKILITVVFFVILRLYLISPIINFISPLLVGVGGEFFFKATKYIFANVIPASDLTISVIRLLIPTICLYILSEKTKDKLFFNVYFVGICINILFMGMDTISYRLAMMFYTCEGFVISESIKKKNIKTILLCCIVVGLDLGSCISLIRGSTTAIPYKNFWFVDSSIIKQ